MHIAVDARNIKAADFNEEQYTLALLQKLIESQPEHHFTIITMQAGLLPTPPNLNEYIVESKVTNYLQLQRWYGKLLPSILKKIAADAFLSINGSVTALNIRQVIFLSSPGAAERVFIKSFFFSLFKKYLNNRMLKANFIATFTGFQQNSITKKTPVKAEQTISVGYAVPIIFNPVSWQQKETFLQEKTNGSEYFLYTGSFAPETFLLVLKAFSLFKKRQLSSMQLIAAGSFALSKNLTEKLATYKYRADVKLYESADMQTLAALTSSAYGVIYLSENTLTAFAVAAALQCGVPVIGLQNSAAVQQLAQGAALYALATAESLAEQMKLLYKDENLRKQLTASSVELMPLINGDIAAQKLWDCLKPSGS